MGGTYQKKEKEQLRKKKRKEKELKKEARRGDSSPKSFEDQLAYVDEFGRITSTPPDPAKKTVINAEDIELDLTVRNVQETIQKGTVKFFNAEKGYGFINSANYDSLFFHINNVTGEVKERDKVVFEVENGNKGPEAVRVTIAT
jgi:cold shock CspA family protein